MEREIRDGTKKAGDEAEAEDDFGGFVEAAERAGSRAGKGFGTNMVRDANGRLREASTGKFAKEVDRFGNEVADHASKSFGDRFSLGLGKRISGFGKLLAPKWIQTIFVWAAVIGPAALILVKQLAPIAGLLGALVPAALGGAAAVGVLVTAFKGIGTAITDAGKDQAAYQKDLKNLSPAAREFVKEIVAAKPALHALRLEIQDRFFTGFAGSITLITKKLLPALRTSLGGLAFQLGDTGKKIVETFSDAKSTSALNQIITGFSAALAAATPGWQKFIDALLVIGKDAVPLLNKLAAGFTNALTTFDNFINRVDKSGQLTTFFDNAYRSLQNLAPAFHDLARILRDIFGSIPPGASILTTILDTVANFFDQLRSSGTLTTLFNAYTQFFTTLSEVLKPLVPVLVQFLGLFGSTFIKILQQLGPPLTVLATALAQALLPILPVLAQLLTSLAPVLGTIAEAIAQLVVAVAPSLPPLLRALAPILVIFAQALAQLFTVAGGALAKLLPPLLSLLTQALKMLLPFVQAVAPVIVDLAKAFGVLLSPGLLGALRLLSDLLKLISPLLTIMTGAFAALDLIIGDDSVGATQRMNGAAAAMLGMDAAGHAANGTIAVFQGVMENTSPTVDKFGRTVCGAMTSIGGPKGCVHEVTKSFNDLSTGISQSTETAERRLALFQRRTEQTMAKIKAVFASIAGSGPSGGPATGTQPGQKVKAHARGYITHGPEFAMIGEGGSPEVVLPTNDPRRARQLLHDSGVAAQMGTGTPVVNVTVLVGNEELDSHIDTRIEYADDRTAGQILAGTRS